MADKQSNPIQSDEGGKKVPLDIGLPNHRVLIGGDLIMQEDTSLLKCSPECLRMVITRLGRSKAECHRAHLAHKPLSTSQEAKAS